MPYEIHDHETETIVRTFPDDQAQEAEQFAQDYQDGEGYPAGSVEIVHTSTEVLP